MSELQCLKYTYNENGTR